MNEIINLGNGAFVKVIMLKGERGSNIATITLTDTSGLVDTYTITLTDGSMSTFQVTNGSSIDRIEKTGTVGNVDTYTVYLTDGTVGGTFEVNNAIATVDTNFSSTSTNPLMNKTLSNIIAGVENGATASKTYNKYDIILRNDSLFEVQSTVASGATWTEGNNIVEKTLGELISGVKSDLATLTKTSVGSAISLSYQTDYTTTQDGYIQLQVSGTSIPQSAKLSISGKDILYAETRTQNCPNTCVAFVRKGMTLNFNYQYGNGATAKFFPIQ